MEQTLEQQYQARENDYSALEKIYRQATGGELVSDPYNSPLYPGPPLSLSASVIIPAWNAHATLEVCLQALAYSSFNRKYSQQLEVIVVDDGSTDGTWDLLENLQLDLHLKIAQQTHHSRAHSQNTAIALAEGDVLISCDADMILAPFALEELVRRHQLLEKVMLLGFRADIDRNDPRIQAAELAGYLPEMLPPFEGDVRLCYQAGGGWPYNMCRDSQHLKALGHGKQLYMADGSAWNLPGLVYGALFSLRRSDFMAMDGYDERFYGWGCEDTLVGVRALAMGLYIIPVYGAAGWHIAHHDRSPRKWQEFAANQRVFKSALHTGFQPGASRRFLEAARARPRRIIERSPVAGHFSTGSRPEPGQSFEKNLAGPAKRGKYLHSLGRFDEAAEAFAAVRGTPEEEAWALFDRGKALRYGRRCQEAAEALEEAAMRLPESAWPRLELALSRAGLGQFEQASRSIQKAGELDPTNPLLRFLKRPVERHLERAARYARQGDPSLALLDYEAALAQDPGNLPTRIRRATALAELGQPEAARSGLGQLLPEVGTGQGLAATGLELARLYLALDQPGSAKACLEPLRRAKSYDREIDEISNQIQATASGRYPLPLARPIIERMRPIPGWFGEDEAELLVGLVWKVLAQTPRVKTPWLVEIGCYCGRATVAMGLAARGLGREDARILAVEEPSLGPAPGGYPASQILRTQLAAHNLQKMAVVAPEDEPTPWRHPSCLLLVDGRHDQAGLCEDLEKYLPALRPGGLLLFHDYASYFPDVQRCVEEYLWRPDFNFVAHTASLIALRFNPGKAKLVDEIRSPAMAST
jgi:glycosyltransferase involved in cell wall biosynthesis/Flp pilus assembly protein TadD